MYLVFSVLISFGIILSALLSFWLSNLIPVSLFFVGAMVSIIHLVFMLSFQDVIYNINYRQRNNENKEASDEIRRLNKSIRALDFIRVVALVLPFVLDPGMKNDILLLFKAVVLTSSIYFTYTIESRLRQEMIVLDNILMMIKEEPEFGKLIYRGLVQYISGGRNRYQEEIWLRISDKGMFYGDEFVKKENITGVSIHSTSQVSYTSTNQYSTAAYIAYGNYAFLNPKSKVERHVDTISSLAINYIDNGNLYTLVLGGSNLNELEYQLRSIL